MKGEEYIKLYQIMAKLGIRLNYRREQVMRGPRRAAFADKSYRDFDLATLATIEMKDKVKTCVNMAILKALNITPELFSSSTQYLKANSDLGPQIQQTTQHVNDEEIDLALGEGRELPTRAETLRYMEEVEKKKVALMYQKMLMKKRGQGPPNIDDAKLKRMIEIQAIDMWKQD